MQKMKAPPASCMVREMETPVPERFKLGDHALSPTNGRAKPPWV